MQRKLGFIESSLAYKHDLLRSSQYGMSAAISGIIKPEFLREAIYELFSRHALLRCTIKQTENQYYLVDDADLEQIPLRVTRRLKADHWKDVLEQEQFEALPRTRYLWKIILLEDPDTGENDLIAIVHHAISDAFSLLHLLKELFNCYRLFSCGTNPNLQPLPMSQPLENLLDKEQSAGRYLEKYHQLNAKKLSLWRYQQKAAISQRKSKHRYLILDEEITHHLEKRAQSNNVSVHSALNAALAISCSRLYEQKLYLGFKTPIIMRNDCTPKIDASQMGCYLLMTTQFLDEIAPDSMFWQAAKTYQNSLKESILDATPPRVFDMETIAHINPGSPERLAEEEEKPLKLTVSHIDQALDDFSFQDLRLNSLYFNTAQIGQGLFTVLHAVTFMEKIYCCLTYTYPLLHEDTIETLEQIFKATIQEATSYEREG